MVHLLGPLWEGLRHVCAHTEPLPDRLCPAKGTCHLVLPLAIVDEIVAMAAQEIASWSVEHSHPPAASRSRTDEPRPLSNEVARRPSKVYRLPYVFPFAAKPSSVTVEQGNLIRQVANTPYALDGAGLPVGPRPAQREPASRCQQALPMKVPHIDALTFAGSGFLIEPVPVAASHAAHNFL